MPRNKGFDTEHGIICLSCNGNIEAGELVVAVYRAYKARAFFIGPEYVNASTQRFVAGYAHLRCPLPK